MISDAPNPLANGVTADLYKAAIGPVGQDYYRRKFFEFDGYGRTSTSWHGPACCTTLNWLIFRKMWSLALAYGVTLLGMALLVFGVGKRLFSYSEATGLASTAQASDTPVGRLVRVRAGPFGSKDEAERAALRIKALELPSVLVRQQARRLAVARCVLASGINKYKLELIYNPRL